MKKIIIDTTKSDKTTVKIQTKDYLDELTEENTPRSQTALILIDKLLKRNDIKLTDISEIEVNSGPGSFTGTRVGVAIANALGFGLDISVNGDKTKIVSPKYF